MCDRAIVVSRSVRPARGGTGTVIAAADLEEQTIAMKMNRLTATPGVPPWRNDSAIKAVFAIAVFLAIPASASSVAPFSTFWAANVAVQGVGHDASGDIFVLGAADTSPIAGHVSEIVMAKLDPSATKVGYFVYLGGSGTNAPRALAVDAQGNAYIAGYT